MTLHPNDGDSLPELVTVSGHAVLEEAEALRDAMSEFSVNVGRISTVADTVTTDVTGGRRRVPRMPAAVSMRWLQFALAGGCVDADRRRMPSGGPAVASWRALRQMTGTRS